MHLGIVNGDIFHVHNRLPKLNTSEYKIGDSSTSHFRLRGLTTTYHQNYFYCLQCCVHLCSTEEACCAGKRFCPQRYASVAYVLSFILLVLYSINNMVQYIKSEEH